MRSPPRRDHISGWVGEGKRGITIECLNINMKQFQQLAVAFGELEDNTIRFRDTVARVMQYIKFNVPDGHIDNLLWRIATRQDIHRTRFLRRNGNQCCACCRYLCQMVVVFLELKIAVRAPDTTVERDGKGRALRR